MNLEQARKIGMEVVEALAPACDRIMIAGSVRRGKAKPKDIEIVYIAKTVKERADLFSWSDVPATEATIREMVDRRYWLFDDVVRRNGPLYKRMMHCATARIVELFRANADNWGYILALRTGPGDFNKIWASKPWKQAQHYLGSTKDLEARLEAHRTGNGSAIMAAVTRAGGGSLPVDIVLKDGFVWHNGRPVPTPTEEEFFERIGLPCWPPESRSAMRLGKFLLDRQRALLQQKGEKWAPFT